MSVKLKLIVLLTISFIALGIVGLTGYTYFTKATVEMDTMYTDRLIPARLLSETRSLVRTMNGSTMEIMLTGDQKTKQELKDEVEKCTKEAKENLTVIENSHLDPRAVELLAKVKDAQNKYFEARGPVISLLMQNKNAEAWQLYASSVKPLVKNYLDNLRELANYYGELSKATNEQTKIDSIAATKLIIGIILVSFVILGISGWFIAKVITSPLKSMVVACEQLAAGDFRDKENEVMRDDEIGRVMKSLKDMRVSIRSILKKIQESAETVAASSEELTANTEQSSQSSTQVVNAVEDVASGTEKQLHLVNTASHVVKQISTALDQVAVNTESVSSVAEKTATTANDGEQAIKKAVSQMRIIEEKTSATAGVIGELENKSKQIGQIVDVISSIAGQTNLLALNAAIEAARAGEAGKGFAVVAEEVRKLAEQSQNATKQIIELIGDVQLETDRAVSFMNDGRVEVSTGAEVVSSAGENFEKILKMVRDITGEIHEISGSIEEIASGSQDVVKAVANIDEESRRAAKKAEAISAATEEQSASMQEIASASEHLAKMAEELQNAVKRFDI